MKSAGSINCWYSIWRTRILMINWLNCKLQSVLSGIYFLISFDIYNLRGTHLFQIIDSLTHPFRTDYCGRGELADRQQKLGQVLSRLQKVAEGRC